MITLIAGNPIPPEALASMPPEKRAKVEEAMKARAGRPITITQKTCVSQKDLDQDRIIKSEAEDSKCRRKVLSKSATKLVMEQLQRNWERRQTNRHRVLVIQVSSPPYLVFPPRPLRLCGERFDEVENETGTNWRPFSRLTPYFSSLRPPDSGSATESG